MLRTAIFLGYLLLLSRVKDLRRVFEYHGAEHKVISCYEASDELTPERAKLYSRLHPRCGTSFLLIVMIMAIFVFAPIGLPAWWILVITRILGVPLIAGLSFEVIKWAGRNRSRAWVRAIMYPGMQLQRLTTAEPDLDQLAVSIASLQAVLAQQEGKNVSPEDLVGARSSRVGSPRERGRDLRVVIATGQLHQPATPSVEGVEEFAGESFHSARWNYDLSGKRVAVIGTGASGVQFVPGSFPAAAVPIRRRCGRGSGTCRRSRRRSPVRRGRSATRGTRLPRADRRELARILTEYGERLRVLDPGEFEFAGLHSNSR